MKVIKVGTTAQSRIAQACDRCRSKKIRCDGITPCCSQCSNVGFECKTSDKLSRRAFPRGYTESLEERVRALESEVGALKDLLDEKDEKIDILSRIRPSSRRASNTSASSTNADLKPIVEMPESKLDTFRVQQSPCLPAAENTDSYFGASSGRSFVGKESSLNENDEWEPAYQWQDTFRAKMQDSGKPCGDFKTEAFFTTEDSLQRVAQIGGIAYKNPPRLVADQLINVFFQEWAPLFPVLHKPTFLALYTKYVMNPETVKDQYAIAQLNLVFGVAALSAGVGNDAYMMTIPS